jgi:hypothetical protein
MLQTYSHIIATAQDGVGDTSSATKTFLKRRINQRYEIVTDKLNTWTQIVSRTFTTGTAAAADQQFYANPPNLKEIESIVLTDSDDNPYPPLVRVDSQEEWDLINSEQVSSETPSRYFPRVNDFGIWPTPNEDDWTGTINYTQRAIPLYFENYTTGSVTVTENDQTITVAGGANLTTGSVKAGFYFGLTDSGGEPRGTYYKIGSVTDTTNAELETYFEEATEAGATYIIGQAPEIPEEGHDLLAIGAIADFYAMKTKDMETYTRYNNMFWTGAPNITPLQAKHREELGGLLGLIDTYKDRDTGHVMYRGPMARDIFDLRNPLAYTTPDG